MHASHRLSLRHVQNGPKMRMMAPAHRAGAIIKNISYVFGTNCFVSYERSETMDGCTEMIICAQSQKNRGDSLTIAHGGRFRPAFLEMSRKCVTALCEHTV